MADSPLSKPRHATELLQKAFQRASKLLPDYEQDELARWLLELIEFDDARWDTAFSDPQVRG